MIYIINKAECVPKLIGNWEGSVWSQANLLEVAHILPESSKHFPRTYARLLYTDDGIYGIFLVHDQFVRCSHTGYQAQVWRDSCVEFFVKPKPDQGYFNFEFNCGGSLLCSYVIDPTRIGDALTHAVPLTNAEGKQVKIYHSLPQKIDPEITTPVDWILEFYIPFAILENYVGSLYPGEERLWRGNFYKCAEDNSHPHWVSWSPVNELNFHLPECFGELQFAGECHEKTGSVRGM
jgi:hypothetical protein